MIICNNTNWKFLLILEGILTINFSIFLFISFLHRWGTLNISSEQINFYDGASKSFCKSSILVSVWCRFFFSFWLLLIMVKDSAFSAFYLSSAIPTQRPAVQMEQGVPSVNTFVYKFIFIIDNWYFIWKVLNRLPFINDKAIFRFARREVEGLQVSLA